MKKYRNEWKFCCTTKDLALLNCRLKEILTIDPYCGPNGKYYVHSLYFDDYKDKCAKDNEAGTFKRFKWRIRYYGNDFENIFLERKEKLFGGCHKEKCKLSLKEYNALLCGDVSEIFWETENSVLKKFCLDIMTKNFHPTIIVDYERIAYIEPISNIRITFDKNISVSYEVDLFQKGEYISFPIQEKDYKVLEVKFDDIFPGYIRNIVGSYAFQQATFSKYYLGRKKIEEVLK